MELFPPSLIGQFLKDSFSDETFQENETFFGAFFTSKMISVPPLTCGTWYTRARAHLVRTKCGPLAFRVISQVHRYTGIKKVAALIK